MSANLAEKYRPRTLDEFAGLEKPKRILSNWLADPSPASWLFTGPPGVGKTTMALALAERLPAELHHIPARACNQEAVGEVLRLCAFAPMRGRWHFVLVDEADEMTRPAQVAFLSALDATAYYQPAFLADPLQPNGWAAHTVFVFTANSLAGLESRFLSRCRVMEFSSYGIAADVAQLLARVWVAEGGKGPGPDFRRIVKDATNNVRDSLMRLELELLAA